MTIGSKAAELAAMFEVKEFERDGEKFTRTIIKRDTEYPQPESELHKICVDLTFTVHEKTSLDSDSVYEFTSEVLEKLAEADPKDRDEASDALCEIEPDVYTSDLTDWLGKSNNNVYYLNDAIEQGAKEGFELLMCAQAAAKRDVGEVVLSYIEGLLE